MSHYNKAIIEGNLTRDPEVLAGSNGNPFTKFTIANNVYGREDANFFDCIAGGKRGEIIAQHFTKGSGIQVDGRIVLQKWTDKDGNKRTSCQIEVQDFTFRGSKKDA